MTTAVIPGHKQLRNGIFVPENQSAKEIVKEMQDVMGAPRPYVPRDSEVLIFKFCFENKLPLMTVGPPGCGKTTFAEWMAYENGMAVINIPFTEETSVSDHRGRKGIWTDAAGGKHMIFHDGPVTQAVRAGNCMIYLDEVRKAREGLSFYYPLTDHRRLLVNNIASEVIKMPDNVMIVASYNPGTLFGSNELEPAFARRFITLRFDHLPREEEKQVILERSGETGERGTEEMVAAFKSKMLDDEGKIAERAARVKGHAPEIADGLTEGLELVREEIMNGSAVVKEQPGDSGAINAMELIMAGFDYATAIAAAIVNPILSDLDPNWRQTADGLVEVIKNKIPVY